MRPRLLRPGMRSVVSWRAPVRWVASFEGWRHVAGARGESAHVGTVRADEPDVPRRRAGGPAVAAHAAVVRSGEGDPVAIARPVDAGGRRPRDNPLVAAVRPDGHDGACCGPAGAVRPQSE